MEVGGIGLKPSNPYPQHSEKLAEKSIDVSSSVSQLADVEKVLTDPLVKGNNVENEESKQSLERLDDRQIEDMLHKGIQEVNKRLHVSSNMLQYSYHKKTKTVMVKVLDAETKQVIREIPEQKALDAIAKMWELAGIMVDEKK